MTREWMRSSRLAVLMVLAILAACTRPPQATEPEISPPPEITVSPSPAAEALPSPETEVSPSPGAAISPSPETEAPPAGATSEQVKELAEDSFRCEVGVDPADPDAQICTAPGEEVPEVMLKIPSELKGLEPQKLRWTLEQPEGQRTIISRVINLRIVDSEGTEVHEFNPPLTLVVPYTEDALARFRELNPDREFVLGYWTPEEQRWIGFNEQQNEFKFVPVPDATVRDPFVCDQEGSQEPIEEGGFGCATIFVMPDPHISF